MNATLRIFVTLLVLTATVSFGNANATTSSEPLASVSANLVTGNIHVEGDILVVDAPSSSILKTTIFETVNQTKVVAFHGCYSSNCEYDIHQLPAGLYYVRVSTDNGIFGAFIQR